MPCFQKLNPECAYIAFNLNLTFLELAPRPYNEGLLDENRFPHVPSFAFAIHVWPYPNAPSGVLLGRAGPIMV